MTQKLKCDVLIVGSGPGGSTIASKLVDAGLSVIVVEEGGYYDHKSSPLELSNSFLKMWRGAGLMTTFGDSIAFAEGKCVGGGSEINSAILQRLPPSILKNWIQQNNLKDLNETEMNHYYDQVSEMINETLPNENTLSRGSKFLKEIAIRNGWKYSLLPRAEKVCVQTNLCSSGCPTSAKQSMINTLLPRAFKKGLKLISNARVYKLKTKDNVVVEALVSIKTDQTKLSIQANHVFLCAGAIQTPNLLIKSGIKRNIGRTLQFHPTVKFLVKLSEKINSVEEKLPLVAITEFMPDIRFGGSVFTLPTFGMSLAEDWKNRKDLIGDYDKFVILYVMIRPDGCGKIVTVPFSDNPLITYKLTERDWNKIKFGVDKLAEGLFNSAVEKIYPSIKGHVGWDQSSNINEEMRKIKNSEYNLFTIHMFASCPMGEHDYHPVDSFGNLKQLKNLTIADASIFPSAPGVNPQATVMALAIRSADHFLGKFF